MSKKNNNVKKTRQYNRLLESSIDPSDVDSFKSLAISNLNIFSYFIHKILAYQI